MASEEERYQEFAPPPALRPFVRVIWTYAAPDPTPIIHDADAWWDMKKKNYQRPLTGYKAIHMPSNTGAGVIISGLCLVMGLALIWYIWWLAAISFIGVLAVSIGHTFNYKRDYYIPADEVRATEEARTRALAGTEA